jgi:hypothetical protein
MTRPVAPALPFPSRLPPPPPKGDSASYRAGLAAALEGLPYRTPEEYHADRRDWMAGHYWGRR